MMTRVRTYSELRSIESFEDRYRYLSLQGQVGEATFGSDRWMNQQFYTSREWRQIRQHVIARDLARDLGHPNFEMNGRIYIHHMNPMTVEDLSRGESSILDPEFLISVSHRTHNAIHYGDAQQLPRLLVERQPGDTLLWKRSS